MTENALNLMGRLALAALFLPAGIGKITGFEGTVGYIASVGLPMATLGALLAVVIETVGGVALIVGFKTRIVALVLAGFALAASLLFLAAHGAGRFSLDGRRGN